MEEKLVILMVIDNLDRQVIIGDVIMLISFKDNRHSLLKY